MKLALNRPDFLRAAKQLCRVAPETSPIDVITGILLSADADNLEVTMTATNLECTLTRTLPAAVYESGSVVVNAVLFAEMLRLFGEASVTVESAGNGQLSLCSGKSRYSVATRPATGFPNIQAPAPDYTAEITGLPSLVKSTAFLAARTGDDLPRRCVRLSISGDAMRAASTDGARLMLYNKPMPGENKPLTLLAPVASFSLLASLVGDDERLTLSSSAHYATFENREMAFTTRLGHGSFIDVDSVLSGVTGCYEAVVESGDLQSALDMMGATAAAGDQLHMLFKPDGIALASNGEQAQCRTNAAARVLTPMPPEEGFYYQLKKLYQGLLAMSGTLRLSVSAAGFLVAANETQTYLQTPVRYREMTLKTPGKKGEKQDKDAKASKKTKKTKAAAKAA